MTSWIEAHAYAQERADDPMPPPPPGSHTRGTKEEADELTALMPVGTRVRYYPGPRSMGYREREIRAPFMVDINGLLVGWLTDEAGYISADHIERI